MTPPPLLTTRARRGSAGRDPAPACTTPPGPPLPGPPPPGFCSFIGNPSRSSCLIPVLLGCSVVEDASVRALNLVEQPVEAGRRKSGHRALEPLHRPGPEIEVDRTDRGLDGSPQRPAVLAGQAEQRGPGDLVPQRAAVVLGDQHGERLVR